MKKTRGSMTKKRTVCTAILLALLIISNLIPARIASLRPFTVKTTAIAQQQQDPMQMMMLIMMLIMMLGQMNQGKQNNDLVAEQKQRQDDAIENLLKEAYGINNQEQPS